MVKAITIRSGDTLGRIAQRHNTDSATLAKLNGIRNPDRIIAGRKLKLPDAADNRWGALADKNWPGTDRDVHGAGAQRPASGTLSLTRKDVLDIKKTVETEWVKDAGNAQAHGIIDTILNRTASGRWGNSVADVVNSRKQFSDINGPVAWKRGRKSVDDIPASRVSDRVHRLVDSYLAKRAAGQPSSIGSHLNYANPNYSSKSNQGWISRLNGPVLGRGNAIHRHGTTPGLKRHRPGEFAIALPGGGAVDRPTTQRIRDVGTPTVGDRTDGNAVAARNRVDVKSANVRIGNLHVSMERAIRAAAEAAHTLGLPMPVVTSGNDGGHMERSLHYSGRALDFRGNNVTAEQGVAFRNEVRKILGRQYDVAFETFRNSANNHLHVEFDPKA